MMHPFTLYRNGKPLTVFADTPIGPVSRLCSTKKQLFLLSGDRLYRGKIPPEDDESEIFVNSWRNGVGDIEVWKSQFYIVTTDGKVVTKDIDDETDDVWTDIDFKDDDVDVEYVKCNGVGQLFVTRAGQLYGAGCCGGVLTTDYPVRLEKFRSSVLDVSAGDDFFVVLSVSEQEEDECQRLRAGSSKKLTKSDTTEEEFQASDDSGKESSPSPEDNITEILKEGYSILTTTVYSFGASNNGVLGTGDHIKRSGVNFVLGLTTTGVCSVSSGKEHTIARTIDGRIFHWGVNSHNQTDYSAPKELSLQRKSEEEAYVLEACCGDYQSIFLNSEDVVEQEILTVSSPNEIKKLPLVLISNQFTLKNHRQLARNYQHFLNVFQLAVRVLLKNRFSVNILLCAQKNGQGSLRFTQQICHSYIRMVYAMALAMRSLEDFYRGDGELEDITFVKHATELLTLLEMYTKYFCDIKSINGFCDIEKEIGLFDCSQRDDFEKIFQEPLKLVSNIVTFLETATKKEPELNSAVSEKLILWQDFLRQNRIFIELAESTQNFWLRNVRNFQISPFRKKSRRVIFDSADIPLKLASSGKFSTNAFILFSDCLCQHGSTLQVFPLATMWVKIDGEKSLKVITPEKTFGLNARSHEDKMLWYCQLETSIIAAIGGRAGSKLSSVRTTGYVFSDRHPKYAGVQAFGRWKHAVMNGTCYLEYPDGRFYFGEVRNGEIEGYGKMIIPQQGLYEGTFKNGKFSGSGIFEMKDNELYDGNFRDGLFHGHGVLRTNTYMYVGEFVANAKNGYGILDDVVSGDKYMGMFADNKKTGAGTCITMNGDYFEGIFVNNELMGEGIAVFENGNYYEGELRMSGPAGKGCYYLPTGEAVVEQSEKDVNEPLMCGNVLTGTLTGKWDSVRVVAGNIALNQRFPKFPKTIGELVVDNSRKWRSLFANFEEEVFGSVALNTPKQTWNRIAIFMTSQKEKDKCKDHESFSNPHSYFAKNITMLSNYADLTSKLSTSLDKISLKSTLSLNTKSPIEREHSNSRKSYSNETIFEKCQKFDREFAKYYDENAFSSLFTIPLGCPDSTSNSTRSSIESSTISLEIVPSFGINSLSQEDYDAIKEYLGKAFKDANHPFSILNQKISNCFYTSYGCWKVKPTPILSKQAIQEWESISCRVYDIVRRLFPALPVSYCSIEGSFEIVSHISLLYPIVLSEGVYSTLFVLYASKYSAKDELYRRKIQLAEKRSDSELAEDLNMDESLLCVVHNESFQEAISTLKQVKEKYCPKEMLEIYEKSMQLITEAHTECNASDESVILAADNIMPLTLFLVLRSGVPHLGAELALLDDLMGTASNFDMEMSGLAGYCYTTITAAYEHITTGNLFD